MTEPQLGEIVLFAFQDEPTGWRHCRGAQLDIGNNTGLYSVIGNQFGGDGKSTFGLPNYQSISPPGLTYVIALNGVYPSRGRFAVAGETTILPYKPPEGWLPCHGQMLATDEFPFFFQAIGNTFGGDGQSSFGLPNLGSTPPTAPAAYAICAEGPLERPIDPFLAEVRLLPYREPPRGWMSCQGQLLPIAQNVALFSLIKNTFGGDERTNFALPNLTQAAVPKGMNYCIALQGVYPMR
jgi:microcystin-dependent protein